MRKEGEDGFVSSVNCTDHGGIGIKYECTSYTVNG